jgi:microcystin-dependent protein
MSQPFLGEIRIFAGMFAIKGWAFCSGQLLSVAQNTALFSVIGINFGGNGTLTFALPNLQGNVPIGQGDGPGLTPRAVGDTGGSPTVTLTQGGLAAHSHALHGRATAATTGTPDPTQALAMPNPAANLAYKVSATNTVPMNPSAILTAGGTPNGSVLPHNNLQPYLAINFIIALNGLFPARN